MYISICQRQWTAEFDVFRPPEEHYDYAVSMLNTGYYEEAREEFGSILSAHPEPTTPCTGWRFWNAMTGRTQDCLATFPRPSS